MTSRPTASELKHNRPPFSHVACKRLNCISCGRDKYLYRWNDISACICWRCSHRWRASRDEIRCKRFRNNRKRRYTIPERIELYRRSRQNIVYLMMVARRGRFNLGQDVYKQIHQYCLQMPRLGSFE